VNQLYYGDNLQVLREHIADESVDLIYLDPPFNSKRDYNLLFKSAFVKLVGELLGWSSDRFLVKQMAINAADD